MTLNELITKYNDKRFDHNEDFRIKYKVFSDPAIRADFVCLNGDYSVRFDFKIFNLDSKKDDFTGDDRQIQEFSTKALEKKNTLIANRISNHYGPVNQVYDISDCEKLKKFLSHTWDEEKGFFGSLRTSTKPSVDNLGDISNYSDDIQKMLLKAQEDQLKSLKTWEAKAIERRAYIDAGCGDYTAMFYLLVKVGKDYGIRIEVDNLWTL